MTSIREKFELLKTKTEVQELKEKAKNNKEIRAGHLEALEYKNKILKEEGETLEQNKKQRDEFYKTSECILKIWVFFLVFLTVAQFVVKIFFENKEGLSDPKFVAIVATATITIIGCWHILGKSIFPKK